MEFKPIFGFFRLLRFGFLWVIFSLVDVTENPLAYHLPADATANCFLPSPLKLDCWLIVQAATRKPKTTPHFSHAKTQPQKEENAYLKKENSELKAE
jgi:hypothetical protein